MLVYRRVSLKNRALIIKHGLPERKSSLYGQNSQIAMDQYRSIPISGFFRGMNIWLVVWNLFSFSIHWEFHHPN